MGWKLWPGTSARMTPECLRDIRPENFLFGLLSVPDPSNWADGGPEASWSALQWPLQSSSDRPWSWPPGCRLRGISEWPRPRPDGVDQRFQWDPTRQPAPLAWHSWGLTHHELLSEDFSLLVTFLLVTFSWLFRPGRVQHSKASSIATRLLVYTCSHHVGVSPGEDTDSEWGLAPKRSPLRIAAWPKRTWSWGYPRRIGWKVSGPS